MKIDAVIAWVDGADPAHRLKRTPFIAADTTSLKEAKSDVRFEGDKEILYCLRSICNHAPWINRIWVITDNQKLPVFQPLAAFKKISIVDHKDIFRGHEDLLPTFNSLSIETMMWRIPSLAEHFIYFNDDMGMCGSTSQSDFVRGGKTVARGRWSSYPADQAGLWQANQVVAAEMVGFSRAEVFIDAHVPKILSRRVFEELFDQHKEHFIKNASYRFRSPEQFLPAGLHEHYSLRTGRAEARSDRDWVHFTIKNCRKDPIEVVNPKLEELASRTRKLYCINDYRTLKARFSATEFFLNKAVGPRHLFETAAILAKRLGSILTKGNTTTSA